MKDDSFTEQFRKAAEQVKQHPRAKMLPAVLGALQQAVQEMQDNGYALTLQLRLRDAGAPDVIGMDRKQIVANGSVVPGDGGTPIDFLCCQTYSDTLYFKAYLGTQEVISLYAYGDNTGQLPQAMLTMLMQVQAEHELVGSYALEDRNSKSARIKGVLPKPSKRD